MKTFIVTTRELAALWGVTPATLANYVAAGMPKLKRGKFDLARVSQWRYDRKEEEIRNRLEHLDGEEQDARLKRVQADIKERELAKIDGNLIDATKVTRFLERMIGAFRSGILVIPTKLAPIMITCKTVPEAKEIMENEIHQVLNELSSHGFEISDLEPLPTSRDGAQSGEGSPKAEPERVGRRKGASQSRRQRRARKVSHVKG